MDLINNLLGKYYNKINQQQLIIEIILNKIKEKTGLEMVNEEIKIKDSILYLKTKPKKKIEVFLKRDLIIQELNNSGVKINQIV